MISRDLKLQLHKYSADAFRNTPWILLISEGERREKERESARARKKDSTLMPGFSVHMYTRALFRTHSPLVLTKLSPLIHFPLPRYCLPPLHLVCARLSPPPALALSLSPHRHPFLHIPSSRLSAIIRLSLYPH
jgi:hypothetical protein